MQEPGPVDWVSAVITHIFSRPEHHGRTYHVVSPRPTPLALIADVIQEAVEKYSALADEKDAFRSDGGWFVDSFRQQIEVYRTYWHDDPAFDDTHRAAAAPLGLSGDGRPDALAIGAVCDPRQFWQGPRRGGTAPASTSTSTCTSCRAARCRWC